MDAAKPVSLSLAAPPQESLLTSAGASSLAFLAHSLGTQTDFPPFLSGFAATTFAPGDDIRAAQPPADTVLLASRLLLGSGIPAELRTLRFQDTLTPAGWGDSTRRRVIFRWDAPLDLAGNAGPRAIGVLRNGQFLSAWGSMLAASRPRADFGIVDLPHVSDRGRTSSPVSPSVSRTLEQMLRVADFAGFAPELVNPAGQSVERLLHDTRDSLCQRPRETETLPGLSEKAQTALVEFVRRGGTLVYFPVRPSGKLLEPLWQAAPAGTPEQTGIAEWKFERGRIIASTSDFYSWVSLLGGNPRTEPQRAA